MLSSSKLLIKLLLYLVGCLYYCISDERSHKHQIKVNIALNVSASSLVYSCQRFGGMCCFYLQCKNVVLYIGLIYELSGQNVSLRLDLVTCWLYIISCELLVILTMHQTTRRQILINANIQGKLGHNVIYSGL